MAHGLTQAAEPDHDRNGTGRHRLDGGNPEVLESIRTPGPVLL